MPLLSVCPWVPIIGNHELLDGDNTSRYLNQTWGEAMANPLAEKEGLRDTATRALTHMLSKGSFLGASWHGTTPSGSSAYFSVDIGLMHITALSTQKPSGKELAWLEKDLAAADANRASVPWMLVTSHYPIFISSATSEAGGAAASAKGWHSEAGELCADGVCSGSEIMSCAAAGEKEGCETVAHESAVAQSLLTPLFNKYSVDIYDAGHSHQYDVTWPMLGGAATQKNYSAPMGTVYITEGNGCVPGTSNKSTLVKAKGQPWARIHGTGCAYGIFTTDSAGTLQYQHVVNADSEVKETWIITDATHKQPQAQPPPPPPPPAPTPAGLKWQCTMNSAYTPRASDKLKDVEIDADSKSAAACAASCNGVKGCVAVRLHGTDKHCHGLMGTSPGLAHFTADSVLQKAAAMYSSCLLVKA